MSVDLFPSTHRTWIEGELGAGAAGLARARTHVMERSRAALVAYVKGARVAALGEPDEIVHDFLAKRLGEADYLARWLASGLPLRRWLMHGVSAHVRALWRARAADARRTTALDDATRAGDGALAAREPAAEEAFDRAWVLATLGEACARARESLADDAAWEVFARHVLDGRSYREIVDESRAHSRAGQESRAQSRAGDESPARSRAEEERLAVATRRVLRAVRAELRAILREDGVRESELDAEVVRLSAGFGA
jgi:hypothetical protein